MNRIKDLRQAQGLTQEELGKKLNVQKSAISKYEKGIVIPNGDVLKRLSAIFNVSTDYLLDNEVSCSEKYSEEETQLLADYRYLDKEGKNLVRSMMKYLRGVIPPSGSRRIQKNGSNFGIVGGNFNSNVTVR